MKIWKTANTWMIWGLGLVLLSGCGFGVKIETRDLNGDGKKDYAFHRRGDDIFMTRALDENEETSARYHWSKDGQLTKSEFLTDQGNGKSLWIHYFKDSKQVDLKGKPAWRHELDLAKSYPRSRWPEIKYKAAYSRDRIVIFEEFQEDDTPVLKPVAA